MKPNDKLIPDEIFNWLSNTPFEDLSAAERADVLKLFSVEDYQDMHGVLAGIEEVKVFRKDEQKQLLLERFDQKHSGGGVIHNLIKKPIEFWKVAAVLVPFVLAVLFVQTINNNKKEISQAIIRDTVYIHLPGAAAAQVVRDTLVKFLKVSPVLKEVYPTKRERQSDQHLGAESDLTVLTIAEFQNVANRVKRNSLQEDSLLLKFAPVSL